jgi:hypothetical protein
MASRPIHIMIVAAHPADTFDMAFTSKYRRPKEKYDD